MKKKCTLFPLLILLIIIVSWQQAPLNEISVTVTGLHSSKGAVLVSLFKDGDGYPDKPEKAIGKGKASFIAGNKAIITFTMLSPGNYAVVILHDENNNHKMDKNWLGFPKEGYGFSNNVTGTFGPPGFSKASFEHDGRGQTSISITTRY